MWTFRVLSLLLNWRVVSCGDEYINFLDDTFGDDVIVCRDHPPRHQIKRSSYNYSTKSLLRGVAQEVLATKIDKPLMLCFKLHFVLKPTNYQHPEGSVQPLEQ